MLKIQKFRFVHDDHLSSGNNGWRTVSSALRFISNPRGTTCYEWLDKEIRNRTLCDSWAGFLHNTISHPEEYPTKYKQRMIPISKLISDKYFNEKLSSCKAIFVFTNQVKKFIVENTGFSKVFVLRHPSGIHGTKKQWESPEKILHVGQQMRKYHSFVNLKTSMKKVLIKPFRCEGDLVEMKNYTRQEKDVEYIEQMDLDEYAALMCRSVVFLDLYDVAACNTILECISLSTPVVVNKLEGCVEYLGESYPLYYSAIEEAESKIGDHQLIEQAHKYLSSMDKTEMSTEKFIHSILTHTPAGRAC